LVKIGKSLANLLIKTGVALGIGIPVVFSSCKKTDDLIINPPKDTTPQL